MAIHCIKPKFFEREFMERFMTLEISRFSLRRFKKITFQTTRYLKVCNLQFEIVVVSSCPENQIVTYDLKVSTFKNVLALLFSFTLEQDHFALKAETIIFSLVVLWYIFKLIDVIIDVFFLFHLFIRLFLFLIQKSLCLFMTHRSNYYNFSL